VSTFLNNHDHSAAMAASSDMFEPELKCNRIVNDNDGHPNMDQSQESNVVTPHTAQEEDVSVSISVPVEETKVDHHHDNDDKTKHEAKMNEIKEELQQVIADESETNEKEKDEREP
jgi:hypothetical protein